MTKELKQIDKALKAYYDKYHGNVVMDCTLIAFDKNDQIISDVAVEWDRGPLEARITNLELKLEDLKKVKTFIEKNNIY
tara:strand:+ start:443 stop:679 length:237 start_codon:yes stop_codon:yes gene_type:complete